MKHIIIYPFLLAIHPVINLISLNIGRIYPEEWLRSLLIFITLAFIIFFISRFFVKDWHKAGLITALFYIVIFVYGEILSWITGLAPDIFSGIQIAFRIVTSLALIVLGIWFILKKIKKSKKISPYLNILSGILLLVSLTGIVAFIFSEKKSAPAVVEEEPVTGNEELQHSSNSEYTGTPDVYYIVLDAYTRADVLNDFYDYDNSEFINYLKDKGFYVASEGRTNYLSTKLVLSAVLNYKYLDELPEKYGRNAKNQQPIFNMIKKNRVVSYFRQLGYKIISITSSEIKYITLDDTDEAISLKSDQFYTNEFEENLLKNTLLKNVVDNMLDSKKTKADFRREQIYYALDKLQKIPEQPGPKFVFTHILCPHDSYVFGPEGEKKFVGMPLFKKYSKAQIERFKKAYSGQVAYLNKLVKNVLTRLLEDSENPPIIIVQGDHGNRMLLQKKVEDTCLKECFCILNALYFPQKDYEKLYPSFSPVNTFRIIFDNYFDTNLGLLEDRTFFSHRYGIYNFIEVTDRVDTCDLFIR